MDARTSWSADGGGVGSGSRTTGGSSPFAACIGSSGAESSVRGGSALSSTFALCREFESRLSICLDEYGA